MYKYVSEAIEVARNLNSASARISQLILAGITRDDPEFVASMEVARLLVDEAVDKIERACEVNDKYV